MKTERRDSGGGNCKEILPVEEERPYKDELCIDLNYRLISRRRIASEDH